MRTARRMYFAHIKNAKFKNWSPYLSELSPSLIWEAKRLAGGKQPPHFPSLPDQDTTEGINDALLSHFFPGPPPPTPSNDALSPYPDHLPLSQEEVSRACGCSSSTAAPGPDSILFSVWKKVHLSCPPLLTNLLNPLLRYAHHPF